MKSYKYFLPILVIISCQSPSFADSKSVAQESIIGGDISYARWSEQPLFLTSSGNEWNFNEVVNMPYSKNTRIHSIACNGSTGCNAVGFYAPFSNANIQKPMIITQKGKDFYLVDTIKNIPNVNFGAFTSLYCNQKQCIAAGYYDHFNQADSPVLIAIGKGFDWTFTKNMAFSTDIKNTAINRLTCNGSTCYAVGNYTNFKNAQKALLLLSKDYGTSWKFVPNVVGENYENLRDIACNGSVCTMVGDAGKDLASAKPIVLTSTDGVIWQNKLLKNPTNLASGFYNKVYMTDKLTVVTGAFVTEANDNKLLVNLSTDNGLTWAAPVDNTNIPQSLAYIGITGITCDNSNNCTLVGAKSIKPSSPKPLILNLKTTNENLPTLEENNNYVIEADDNGLNTISCKKQNCIISGGTQYNRNGQLPLVLLSKDGGKNWDRLTKIPYLRMGNYSHFTAIK